MAPRRSGRASALTNEASRQVEVEEKPIIQTSQQPPSTSVSSADNKPNNPRDASTRMGAASRVVYDNTELRARILQQVDRGTLAGMMRLEKGVVASVSAVLYRKIHASVMTKIGRSGPRREVYCNSVLTIDRTPLPDPSYKPPSTAISAKSSVTLNLENLLESAMTLRLAFPNLQALLCEQSQSGTDDTYVARFSSEHEEIDVDLRSHCNIDIAPTTPPPSNIFPIRSKSMPGIRVRHTIHLHLQYGLGYTSPKAAVVARWKVWLFRNPELDPRLDGLSFNNKFSRSFDVTKHDITTFLTHRKAGGCQPIQAICFLVANVEAADQLQQLASLVGPGLKELSIELRVRGTSLATLLAGIDKTFPHLRKLAVLETNAMPNFDLSMPLSGMASLISFHYHAPGQSPAPPLTLARYLLRMGSSDCSFVMPGYDGEGCGEGLKNLVSKLRSTTSDYAYLHTISTYDLDLVVPADLSSASIPPSSEQLKRGGWLRAADEAARLKDSRTSLQGPMRDLTDRVDVFQQAFDDSIRDLSGTEGDVVAQGEILRRGFEAAQKHKISVDLEFLLLRHKLSTIEEAVGKASLLATTWLANQAQNGR